MRVIALSCHPLPDIAQRRREARGSPAADPRALAAVVAPGLQARRPRQRRCKSRDAARTIPCAWSRAPDQTALCTGSWPNTANELN